MVAHLKFVRDLLIFAENFELTQIPLIENAHTDALSNLANSKDSELLMVVPVEHILKPFIATQEVIWVEGTLA